jgi:murein L,D-transpeptidase YafK
VRHLLTLGRDRRPWPTVRGAGIALAAAVIVAGDVSAMGGHPLSNFRFVGRNMQSAEAMLVQSLLSVRENRLEDALRQIDALLQTTPNFRLAQLVKGDLLMARAHPINNIGNIQDAPTGAVNDLREEARARLQRYRLEQPKDLVPKYLLQMQPQQKYAVVVDTTKSTLYVFENDGGRPRYAADYYITVGKNGFDKAREGDKKTPLGVYHVVTELPRNKLADFYGNAAWPINYPNEWDERMGRKGHGIWLHGTPRDTYSRPPRASDGCVVLNNQDLDQLGTHLQAGLTPVVIADGVEWIEAKRAEALRAPLLEQLELWRKDWEGRDNEAYLSHYARSFASTDMSLTEWATQKRRVNASKEWIKLKVSDVSIMLYPGREDLAVVTFLQDYSSNNLANQMRKRQYWLREGNSWKIAYEGSA